MVFHEYSLTSKFYMNPYIRLCVVFRNVPRSVGLEWCPALAAAAVLLFGPSAQAADQTWNGGSVGNGNWGTGVNWVGGAAPGSTAATNNQDVATFNGPIANTWGATSGNPIVIDSATQNIGSINFDTNAGNYFLGSTGGNTLRLTTGNKIELLSTLLGSNKTITINTPLIVGTAAGAASTSFINNSAAATNALILGGQISAGTTGILTVNLNGVNTGSNTVRSNIVDGLGTVRVTKSGAGTWVLSGTNNTFTGGTAVTGGRLLLDMNAGGSLASTGALALGFTAAGSLPSSGMFQIDGKAGTASSQTMGNLTVSGNSTIKLNPGASGGTVNLTLGNTWTRAGTSGGTLNIDLSAGNATLTSNVTLINGLIPGASGSQAYATVTDATATGLATIVSGTVARYTGAVALTTTPITSVNYITSGINMTAIGKTVNTLQLDATAAGVGNNTGILDLNGTTFGLTAKTLLVTGTGNVTVQNGLLGSSSNELLIQQYATGTLTVSANIGGSGAAPLTKAGPGMLILTGSNVSTGNIFLNGGVLRDGTGTSLSPNGSLTINNGVIETSANITRTIGTAAGNVRITGGTSGFSAFGGAVGVTLGGGQLVWDSANFMPEAFVLNESTANNTINLTNAIDLNGASRTINVNASAVNTATISGVLSSSVAGGGLIKGGVGTLILSATNTYGGTTLVSAGTLLVSGGLSNTSAVTISGGTLELGANNSLNSSASLTMSGGTFDAQTFTNTLGALTLSGDSFFDLGSGAALTFADSSAATWGAFTLDLTGFVSGSSLRFGTTNAGLTSGQLAAFSAPAVSEFGLDTNGFLINVPEPATSLLVGLGLVGVLFGYRRRRA